MPAKTIAQAGMMSVKSSSAPSFAAPKIVGRNPVSGVKIGISCRETALQSRQIVRRRKNGTRSMGRK